MLTKYYRVNIGGSLQSARLEDFMTAVEELAAQYKDIEVKIESEYFGSEKK